MTTITETIDIADETQIKPFTMNFGPQHLTVRIEGEITLNFTRGLIA